MAYKNIELNSQLSSNDKIYDESAQSIGHQTPPLVAYKPIGIGKPLCIQIMTMYTGAFSQKKKLLKHSKHDLLCISGVKDFEIFTHSQRAINVFKQHIAERSFIDFSSFEDATPYVYYKKALTEEFQFTIELSISVFDDDIFTSVSSLFDSASKLPIFMPAAGKLVTAGRFVNLLKAGVDNLFKPVRIIDQTISIQFDTAGMPVSSAQSMFIYPSEVEYEKEFSGYRVETKMVNNIPQMRLVSSNDIEYAGDTPYIIINLDGAEKPELDLWHDTRAASGMISKFYNTPDTSSNLVQDLKPVLQLYSNYQYFQKASDVVSRLKGMKRTTPPDTAYTNNERAYRAYVANIDKDSLFASQVPALPAEEAAEAETASVEEQFAKE